jgi:hypothetical protein
MTPESVPHCRMNSSSRHIENFKPAAAFVLLRMRGDGAVPQRNEYASVVCVSPVASSRRAGIVFSGHRRRIGLSGFSKISPQHQASRVGALCPSIFGVSPLPARRAAVALECRRRANAGRRLRQYQRQYRIKHGFRRDGPVGRFGSSNIVSEARRYLGGNPTGRASLWCARFMNMVLQRTG